MRYFDICFLLCIFIFTTIRITTISKSPIDSKTKTRRARRRASAKAHEGNGIQRTHRSLCELCAMLCLLYSIEFFSEKSRERLEKSVHARNRALTAFILIRQQHSNGQIKLCTFFSIRLFYFVCSSHFLLFYEIFCFINISFDATLYPRIARALSLCAECECVQIDLETSSKHQIINKITFRMP